MSEKRVFQRPAGWVLLLTALFVVNAHAGQLVEERAPADPKGEVVISNVAGRVEVSVWNRDEVEVTGELGEGTERLEFDPGGSRTLIKVILDEDENHSSGSDLNVRIPVGSRLSVNTVSADIEVQGVEGSQKLHTVSGDINTQLVAEDVELQTVSGDAELRGAGQANLTTLTTVSGDAELSDIAGELLVQTVTGDVEIKAGELSRLRLNTTNGDMEIGAKMAEGARFSMESINGDLDLRLSGDLDATFDIQTFNGDIDNCFGPEATRTSKFMPGRELRFTEGNGEGRVAIETLNGDIGLCAS